MSEPTAPAGNQVESDEALFDIVVQLAKDSSLERVKDRALNDLAMEPLKVEALIRALQSGPTARIGSAGPKSRAEKARDDFTKVGLKVTLSPVLSISKMTAAESDGKTMCPACDVRVILPENRQCPNCNVFVDKVDEQFLLRKKLMEQERRRAEMALDREKKASAKASKEAMERELREQIRKEVEAEKGISGGKGGANLAGKLKLCAAALGLAGVAFFGGKMVGGGSGAGDAKTAAGKAPNAISASAQSVAGGVTKGQDMDQVLQNLPSAGTLDPASAELLDDAAQEEALLKSARNGGPNAKGIPMDQALAASMTLAQAAGNSTAQRAMSGASGPAGAGPAGAGAAGGSAGAAPFVPVPLPADFKPLMSLEFADQLAQMGQSARARGVVREIQAVPNPTPALAAATQVSDVTVSAWGIGSATADKSKKLFENVRSGIAGMRDPAAKAKAASSAATAIAIQSRTPEQTAQPFLAQAAEAVGQITDPGQKQEAGDQVVVATAQVLLAGVNAAAKTGNWERANDLTARLQATGKQGRTAGANARVMALLYQAKSVTSADGSAVQALEGAIAEASKAPGLVERILALQAVGEIAGSAAAPSLLKSLQAIEPAAAQAAGAARVQALGAMSAAYASLGDEVKAEDMRRQIATSAGVPALDQQMEMAKALLRADVSLARFQQKTGAFAQAENTIMRAASYLFAQAK
ncbi:MAG: hypothetical protein ACKO1L_04295 [Brachymonas sp.]